MTSSAEEDVPESWITVSAFGLSPIEFDALISRVTAAAHALGQDVCCSATYVPTRPLAPGT